MPLSLVAGLKGGRLYKQFVWLGTASCGGIGTLKSTNALDMLIQ